MLKTLISPAESAVVMRGGAKCGLADLHPGAFFLLFQSRGPTVAVAPNSPDL